MQLERSHEHYERLIEATADCADDTDKGNSDPCHPRNPRLNSVFATGEPAGHVRRFVVWTTNLTDLHESKIHKVISCEQFFRLENEVVSAMKFTTARSVGLPTGGRLRYSGTMNENTIVAENQPSANPEADPPEPLATRIRKYLQQFSMRVMVYLLMYFLISFATIGPFFWAWFESAYVGGPRWVHRFYAPLVWLCDRISWLSWLVNQYVDWWIR